MPFIIGLTGGIGCGKTSASKLFANLGIDIIDTDEIARELTQSEGAAISAIRKVFGDAYVTTNGALDRKQMRQLVFSDSTSRQKLEKILHPFILTEAGRRSKLASSPYVIMVIPLLFETNDYDKIIQRSLVIDCDEMNQITRTMKRSKLNEQEVRAIIAAQISRQKRLQRSDDVIVNNNGLDYLQKQVKEHHQKYLALSKN
jgi:dephospho-CoA kinase